MRLRFLVAALLLGAAPLAAEDLPASLGGDTSRAILGPQAFTLNAANQSAARQREFFFGNRLFNTNWVIAPASTTKFDGLGPTFNRVSCSSCHTRDGRGRSPAEAGGDMMSMLVRLSVPGIDAHGGPKPHPAYGDQLQDRAIPGVPAEGRAVFRWTVVKGSFADGSAYVLRKPEYKFAKLAFGDLGPDILTSPRVAPQMIGLGLLEAIPEAEIRAGADPDDKNGDGISGRVNEPWDFAFGKTALGRFGWKANQPSLRQQNAAAFNGDMGLTTSLFPATGCSEAQKACRKSPNGGQPEVEDEFLRKLTLYTQTLAVPVRRKADDPAVKRGEMLFGDAGCTACHRPTWTAGVHEAPEVTHQTFHPFTDLLLHDMGEGLADGRPDFLANGREWRTPPLWGLGMIPVVNGHDELLHDGRARGPEEAILWHGGEAEKARERFKALPKADRDALVAFLRSL
jgi:CxxC motif-containing protein (DUF1111 family)